MEEAPEHIGLVARAMPPVEDEGRDEVGDQPAERWSDVIRRVQEGRARGSALPAQPCPFEQEAEHEGGEDVRQHGDLLGGGATLGVVTWAEGAFDRTAALTMGVVTFSVASLLFSLSTRDEGRTVFSLDILSDKTFIRSTALSIITLVLTTVLGPLQAFLGTIALDTQQWLVCIAASLPVLIASELRVVVSRRRAAPRHP